jgi:hypothetical protein
MKRERNVVYKIVDRIGFYDIVAKFIDGIEVKRFKQFAR